MLRRVGRLSWREAGPPNHFDDDGDSDEYAVNKEVCLSAGVVDTESVEAE